MPDNDRPRRMSALIAPWVDQGLETHGMGEDAYFEVTLMPTPEGAALGVLVNIPGPTLDSRAVGMMTIDDIVHVTREHVVEKTGELLRGMREQRREATQQIISKGNGKPPVVPDTITGSGLTLPPGYGQ